MNQHSKLPFAVKAVLLYACSLTTMSIATISPSLPRIATAFREIPNVEFLTKLLLAIPALFIALTAPLAGFIVDKGHRKSLLLWSLVLYALAGTSGLYIPTLTQLLAARVLLGVAIAGIMTAAQTLIADYYEGAERNQMMGLQGAFTAAGGVVFIGLAGFLADYDAAHGISRGGWRLPFWLYAASLPLLPAVAFLLHEPFAKTSRQESRQEPPQATNSLNNQAPTRRTLPVLTVICVTTFLGMAAYYTIPTQLPFFLTGLGVRESSRVGMAIAIANLVGGAASLLMPVLKRRINFSRLCFIAFAAFAVGFAALSQATNYTEAFCCALFCGFGIGMLMPTMKLWTMNSSPLEQRGKAIGAMTAAMFFGQFASPIVVQPLVAAQGIAFLFLVIGAAAALKMLVFAAFKPQE